MGSHVMGGRITEGPLMEWVGGSEVESEAIAVGLAVGGTPSPAQPTATVARTTSSPARRRGDGWGDLPRNLTAERGRTLALAPELVDRVRVARMQPLFRDLAVGDVKDLHALVVERSALPLAGGPGQDDGVVVVRQHLVDLQLEGPTRQLEYLLERGEDLVLTVEVTGQLAPAGGVPGDVVREQVAQRRHVAAQERVVALADELLIGVGHVSSFPIASLSDSGLLGPGNTNTTRRRRSVRTSCGCRSERPCWWSPEEVRRVCAVGGDHAWPGHRVSESESPTAAGGVEPGVGGRLGLPGRARGVRLPAGWSRRRRSRRGGADGAGGDRGALRVPSRRPVPSPTVVAGERDRVDGRPGCFGGGVRRPRPDGARVRPGRNHRRLLHHPSAHPRRAAPVAVADLRAAHRGQRRPHDDREPWDAGRSAPRRHRARCPRPRDAGLAVLLGGAQTLVRGALNVLIVVAALGILHMGESGVGVLTAAIGAGGFVGSLIAMSLVGRRLAAPIGVALILWGVPIAAIGAV